MPIVGESARLYFQDEIDAAPIVTGCVRKNGSTCEAMSNTDNRYFATESGNYLDMLPGAISFRRSGLNVNLNDKNGITLSSSGNLSIGASGNVNLNAGSVSINATSKLLVQKNKSSYISLENEFYAKASAVYENGSDRQSNPKFTDDEPTAGVAEAIAKQKAESMKFNNENLVAAILGGKALSLQSNPFDKSNQSSLVPTSKDSVPLQGNDLKNRADIPEYNPAKVYKQDTIVKYKSLDGEYILGTAGVPKQGTNKIIFTPYDKESYTQHNSPADAGKSIALGVVDSGQKVVFGTLDLATYGWQGLNYGTGIVSDGYKNVFGVSPFDGMFDYKPEFWEGVRGGSDKLSSKFSGFLHGMAPHDKMFNSGKALTNYMMAVDGIAGGISVVKNITKLINGGLKIAGNSVAKLEETFGVFGSSKREMAIESNISNSVGKAGREIDDILDTSKVGEDIVSTDKSGEIGKTIESDTNKLKNNNLEDIPNSTKDETGKVNQVDEGVGEAGNKLKPSNPPNLGEKPRGTRTKISKKADEATKRSLERENEAAEILARNGYDVEQNPKVEGTSRESDYRIEGELVDCYSPSGKTSVRNIGGTIKEKVVDKQQASRVVLNLKDWNGDISDIVEQLKNYPIEGLDEVIAITKEDKVISIYP